MANQTTSVEPRVVGIGIYSFEVLYIAGAIVAVIMLRLEILSRSTAKLDLVDKRYDYAAAGVSEYWIIDPETQTVEIYALESGALSLKFTARGSGTLTSILLSHLTIDLAQLFADL